MLSGCSLSSILHC